MTGTSEGARTEAVSPVFLRQRPVALAMVERVLDDQDWRRDRAATWGSVLRFLAGALDEDGIVAGISTAQIVAATGTTRRTLCRVIAWAVDAGLLLVVPQWTSPPFGQHGPSGIPMYVFTAGTAPRPLDRS